MSIESTNLNEKEVIREVIDLDVLFVGAGPANLSAAIHLQNLIDQHNQANPEKRIEPQIGIIEKGARVGDHLLSGAVLDPIALKELIPDFQAQGCPIESEVTNEKVMFLTDKGNFSLPYTPAPLKNHGKYIISLNKFGEWLGTIAEKKGINIFTGFPGAEMRYDGGKGSKKVIGVQTGDRGIDKNGKQKENFEPGVNINAKVTVLGEGPRGSLTKALVRRLGLDSGKNPQSYETGVKEIWEIPAGRIKKGTVYHSFGFPLPTSVYGGSWIYAISDTTLSVGFVTALDSESAGNDPHFYLQKFKTHPFVKNLLTEGKMVGYGAKTISGGGYYAMPKLYGDGFLLTGESGGFLNMMRLKGIHLSMKSGMLAAESIFEALLKNDFSAESLKSYETKFEASWAKNELFASRNFRQAFDQGLYIGLLRAGTQLLFGGKIFKERLTSSEDYTRMQRLGRLQRERIRNEKAGFKYDGKLTFDKLNDVYESKTTHEENQPCHLYIKPEIIADICNTKCTVEYGNPCQHFCPAAVYEMVVINELSGAKKLQINASNCVHCKTCDIADPYQVITWKVPEGGGGPIYTNG
ncbi:MAG: electron transfer flavoprotein-ubiquinone oxidoreductase [Chloroherpetonaceae bacterium]|nr:electron transfer flavoprotein-ubiquinone oxidoreductase [Chloroherpetonaceae bacterium]